MTRIVRLQLFEVIIPRAYTSLNKHVPEYEIPLLERRWRESVEMGQKLSVSGRVGEVFGRDGFVDVEVDSEESRLRGEYGDNFDAVYPARSFRTQFDLAVAESGVAEVSARTTNPTAALVSAADLFNPNTQGGQVIKDLENATDDGDATPPAAAEDDFCRIRGITEPLAQRLKDAGYHTFYELSTADLADLIALEGVGAAKASKIRNGASAILHGEG